MYNQLASILKKALVDLDMSLTGNSPSFAEHVSYSQLNTQDRIENWLDGGDIYYFSDGGYSRVRWLVETDRVSLCSESTPRVKAKWNYIADARSEVEDAARTLIHYLTQSESA